MAVLPLEVDSTEPPCGNSWGQSAGRRDRLRNDWNAVRDRGCFMSLQPLLYASFMLCLCGVTVWPTYFILVAIR